MSAFRCLRVPQVRFVNLALGSSSDLQLAANHQPLPLSAVGWRLSTLLKVHP